MTEFAAILFETNPQPNARTYEFYRWLDPEGYVWSRYCLKLHAKWIAEVNERLDGGYHIEQSKHCPAILPNMSALWLDFRTWLDNLGVMPMKGLRPNITCTGKNFGSFDKQFLIHGGFPEIFRHRTADWVQFYQKRHDVLPPELKLCKTRAIEMGCPDLTPEVAHNALDDALDVMKLVQFAYKDMPG